MSFSIRYVSVPEHDYQVAEISWNEEMVSHVYISAKGQFRLELHQRLPQHPERIEDTFWDFDLCELVSTLTRAQEELSAMADGRSVNIIFGNVNRAS